MPYCRAFFFHIFIYNNIIKVRRWIWFLEIVLHFYIIRLHNAYCTYNYIRAPSLFCFNIVYYSVCFGKTVSLFSRYKTKMEIAITEWKTTLLESTGTAVFNTTLWVRYVCKVNYIILCYFANLCSFSFYA